jgi:hypothetical protein
LNFKIDEEVVGMAVIEIYLSNEKPAVAMLERETLPDPLLTFCYSGFQLYLSEPAMLQLKHALKDGEGKLEYYRRRMETANNLLLPFFDV